MTEKAIATKKAKQHTIYKNAKSKRIPGVTTILSVMAKPWLIKWANDLGLQGIDSSKYVNVLTNIGTLAHSMVEHDAGGSEPDLNQYSKDDISLAENSFLKYLDWKSKIKFSVIKSELQCISEKYQYGGTCDMICTIDNVLTLLDIKTSKAVYSDQFTQVAGYAIILEELGYEIENHIILRLGRNETEGFESISIPNINLHKKRFLLCRELYELNKQVRSSK